MNLIQIPNVKPEHVNDSVLLLMSENADIASRLTYINRTAFWNALKPLRATSFNSSGLIQASEIKLPSGFADKNILKLVIDIARASDFQRSFRVRLRFLSTPLRSSLAGLCLYEKDLYQAVQKNHSIQRSGPSKGADNLNHDQNDMGIDLDLQPLPHQSTTRGGPTGFIHTCSDDGGELDVDDRKGRRHLK